MDALGAAGGAVLVAAHLAVDDHNLVRGALLVALDQEQQQGEDDDDDDAGKDKSKDVWHKFLLILSLLIRMEWVPPAGAAAGQTGDTDRAAGGDGGRGVGEGLKFRQLLLHGEGDLAGRSGRGNGEVHGARPPEGVAEIRVPSYWRRRAWRTARAMPTMPAKPMGMARKTARKPGRPTWWSHRPPQPKSTRKATTPRTVNRCRPVSGSPGPPRPRGAGRRRRRGRRSPARPRPAHRRRRRCQTRPRKEENGLNQQDQRGGYGDVEQNVVQGREGLPPGCHEWVPPFSKWGCDLS